MIGKTIILYTVVALTTTAELPNTYDYAAPDRGFPAAPGGGSSSGGGHAGSGGGHAGSGGGHTGSGGGQGGGANFQGQAGGFHPQGGSRGGGFDGSSGTHSGGGFESGSSRVTSNTQYQPSGPIIPILRDERQGPDQYGNYNFQFETGNGISRQEQGAPGPNGAVISQGGWSFTFPDGTPAVFNFVADENGYRVESDLIPTPHPLPAHALAQIEFAEQQKAAGIPFDDGSYRGAGGSGRYSGSSSGSGRVGGPSTGSGRVGGSSAGGFGSASTTQTFGGSPARNTGSSTGGFTGASSRASGDYGASPTGNTGGSAGGFGGAAAGGFGGTSSGGFPGASTAGNIGGVYSADSSDVLVRNIGSPTEGVGAPGVHRSSSRPALHPQSVSTPSRIYGTP